MINKRENQAFHGTAIRHGVFLLLCAGFTATAAPGDLTYPIVDTNQRFAYNESHAIEFPDAGERFHGQDAQYASAQPGYRDNGDGTVSDLVTGLMWTKDMHKMGYSDAVKGAPGCDVGGYSDWRLPSIKEMYSLIQFNGEDPDPSATDASAITPFIEASVFNFKYGDPDAGERIIDSQFATTAINVSPVMNGQKGVFGVNLADGRIKCYPIESRGGEKQFMVMYVRGNPDYGKNKFRDNGDGTVTDLATGLMWMKADSLKGMDWPSALEFAESLELAGYDDWRLPNAKELQSIVDYSRSPDATDSAAIDPVFDATVIQDEIGRKDFGWYWTGTTHLNSRGYQDSAVYVCFGRSGGWMPDRRSGEQRLLDVHGAGAQRSDPKIGDASRFPYGRGPQGDVIRIENLVRCVRGGNVVPVENGPEIDKNDRQLTQRGPGGDRMVQGQPPRQGVQGRARPGGRDRPDGSRSPGAEAFLRRFDKDSNGSVEKSEFDGPAERFNRLDMNRDGVISGNEIPTGPPPDRR